MRVPMDFVPILDLSQNSILINHNSGRFFTRTYFFAMLKLS